MNEHDDTTDNLFTPERMEELKKTKLEIVMLRADMEMNGTSNNKRIKELLDNLTPEEREMVRSIGVTL